MNPHGPVTDWDTYLTGSTPCLMSRLNGPSKAGTGTTIGALTMRSTNVTAGLPGKLQALAKADHCELAALLRTAWAVLLRCYTGQDDVSFGFQDGTDDMAIARFIFSDSSTVSETVQRTKAELTGPLPHLPPGHVSPTGDRPPRFDTAVVVLQHDHCATASHPSATNTTTTLRLLAKCSSEGTVDLTIESPTNATLLGFSYPHTLQLVACTLSTILSGILTGPTDTPIGSLNYLGQSNLEQLVAWNSSVPIDDPVDRCIHHLIADRVRDRPHAEAVCAWDGSLTYLDLDAIADRLAARLVQLGVGPEVLVPLCFDKSVSISPLHFCLHRRLSLSRHPFHTKSPLFESAPFNPYLLRFCHPHTTITNSKVTN
jgi:non-ribosomal peptide synthetase component F